MRDRITISIVDEKPHRSFTAKLNLAGLGLPPEAKVFIEPYYKTSFMRFAFGTVKDPVAPSNTALTDIPRTTVIRFRVKVVDESQKIGRIIQLADKIKPTNVDEDTGGRQALLWIDYDQDLDQQVFRLSFKTDMPTLEINSRLRDSIGDVRELVKSNQLFHGLVFPAVVREIAAMISMTGDDFELGDDSWQSLWLGFFTESLHVNVDIDFGDTEEGEKSHWVEEVVAAFCRKYRSRSLFEQSFLGGRGYAT